MDDAIGDALEKNQVFSPPILVLKPPAPPPLPFSTTTKRSSSVHIRPDLGFFSILLNKKNVQEPHTSVHFPKDEADRPSQQLKKVTTASIPTSQSIHTPICSISISKPVRLRASSTSSALNFGTASLPDKLKRQSPNAATYGTRTAGGQTRGAFDPPPLANLPAVRQPVKSFIPAVNSFSHLYCPRYSSSRLHGCLDATPVVRPFSIHGS
jgi:hypothetical protein